VLAPAACFVEGDPACTAPRCVQDLAGTGNHDWPCYREAFLWALPRLIEAIAP
jgi:hypothetical protein